MGQFAKISLLSGATLLITGCAQLGAIGNFAKGATETTANFFYKPVASLLRGTPNQDYVFDDAQEYDVVLYEGRSTADDARVIPPVPPAPVPAYDIEIYDQAVLTQTSQSTQPIGSGFYHDEPLPVIPDISYAKIGGGSQMTDWSSCEAQSGGYLYWEDGIGYKIDPKFDTCMRGKGYALESEIARMSGGVNSAIYKSNTTMAGGS